MKNLKVLLLALLVGAFLFQACDDDDDEVTFKMTDRVFVEKATSSNNLEIKAGELAVKNGSHADVKQFAAKMIAEHGLKNSELKLKAEAAKISVDAGYMTADDKNMLAKLDGKTGTEFDKEYAKLMVDAHKQAVNLFEKATETHGVPDVGLKEFATKTLPALKGHLKDAESLNDKLNK